MIAFANYLGSRLGTLSVCCECIDPGCLGRVFTKLTEGTLELGDSPVQLDIMEPCFTKHRQAGLQLLI